MVPNRRRDGSTALPLTVLWSGLNAAQTASGLVWFWGLTGLMMWTLLQRRRRIGRWFAVMAGSQGLQLMLVYSGSWLGPRSDVGAWDLLDGVCLFLDVVMLAAFTALIRALYTKRVGP